VGEVHLFEPSGFAGVFQHTCRLGELLSRRDVRVVVHTGHQHERVTAEGVELCRCSWWPRDQARGLRRSALIGVRFVTRTLPHLGRAVPRGAVLHVEGISAAGPLTLLALGLARLGGRRVVYSPHDTFSRRGRLDAVLLRLALRVPQDVVVHSHADVELLRASGVRAHFAPLVQLVPSPSELQRTRWREEWGASEGAEVVVFAGCIRPEKRLDLLIRSARAWPSNRVLAVVGEDRGAWAGCAALAREQGVELAARVEFVDLDEFTAALAAADVVVAPHDKASQSGVLSVAAQLGIPTVAAGVGGLGELASRTFAAGDVADLTRAIDAQLVEARRPPAPFEEELALRVHMGVYGLLRAL
jgi:glycosyltransferase involved in cell wall biosynthesis